MKTTFRIRGLLLPALLALNFATSSLGYAGRDHFKPTNPNTHQSLSMVPAVTRSVVWNNCSLDDLDSRSHKKAQEMIDQIITGEDRSKPETLQGDLEGLMSRRITKKDRLVYSFDQKDKKLEIYGCGSHYKF